MIVTCESCKSRYKIDDSKISGRGARITCPRCKHQFVVFSSEKNQPAMLNTPQGSEWDDEPTRVGAKKEEAARAAASAAASSPAPATPAPEDERSGPSYEVMSPRQVQKVSPAEAAARAPTLDFRKVGINAWKVKVKIGLIYDFSDLKTLRKYIQDGRVTPADLISFDGKSWKVIGEIPDLDVFFVDTYDQLFAEMSSRPPEENVGRTETPRSEARMETPSLPDGMSLEDVQEKRKPKQQQSGKKGTASMPPPNTGGDQNRNNLIILAVVVLLALAAGLWWADRQQPAPAPAPAPSSQAPVDREKLRNDLITKMQPAELPPEPPKVEEPKLVPVGPRDTPPATPSNGVTPSNSPSSSADYVAAGDSAARAGRWADAVKAYAEAAKKEPKNGNIKAKQGLAQFNAGNTADARTSLEEAVRLGAGKGDVLKTLGNILMADGDNAGAREYFQKYLDGKPKDAAAIEKKLKEMNGG